MPSPPSNACSTSTPAHTSVTQARSTPPASTPGPSSQTTTRRSTGTTAKLSKPPSPWPGPNASSTRNWSFPKLSTGGIMGLIVPSQVLYQDYAKLLRKNLVDTYRIDFVVDHSHVRVFQEATIMTCILIVSKQLTPPGHLINVIKITEESTCEDNPLVLSKHLPIAQSSLQKNQDTTFRFDTSPGVTNDLGAKIVSNTHLLGDICYGSVGVVPHSEKEGKPKEHYIFSYMHDAKCKPYIEGKEVDRYTLNWRGRFLQY